MYDPAIGRWFVQEPLADMYQHVTPYNYCFNNPINFADPFGLDTVSQGNGKRGDIVKFKDKDGGASYSTPLYQDEKDAATIKDKKSSRIGFGFDGTNFGTKYAELIYNAIYAMMPTTISLGVDHDAAIGPAYGVSLDIVLVLKGANAGSLHIVKSGRLGTGGPFSSDVSGHGSVGYMLTTDRKFVQGLTAQEILNTDFATSTAGFTGSQSTWGSYTAGIIVGGSYNYAHSMIEKNRQSVRYSSAGLSVGATGGISGAGGSQYSRIVGSLQFIPWSK